MPNKDYTQQATAVDRAISWAFPGWGLRRQQARIAAEFLATLAPLKSDRATGVVPANPSSLDEKIPWQDRLAMIDLFDVEFCESPLLSGLADQFVRNVIPASGLRPIADTGDESFDDELTKRFDDYAETAEIRGLSLWEFQRVLLKSVIGHGDGGVFHLPDGKLQGIPAAKVTTPSVYANREGTAVHQGIYTGGGIRPLGYYVTPRDRWGAYRWTDTRFLDASQVWWFGKPEDFDSYRGRSAFLPTFQHLRMLRSILRYREFQAKMASVFGIAIIKSPNKARSPLAGLGSAAESRAAAETGTTRADLELFAGMGMTLNPDEDIRTIEGKLNAADFGDFVRLVCSFVGVAVGLPLEFVLQDWTRGNYYGNRMAAQAGMRAFLYWWTHPARLVREVWRERVGAWIADGTVTVPAGVKNDPLVCSVTLPPPVAVDEEKDLDVTRAKIESNLGAMEDYARQQGTTLRRILDARKREVEAQRRRNLPIPATVTPGIRLLSELEAEAAAAKAGTKAEPKPGATK